MINDKAITIVGMGIGGFLCAGHLGAAGFTIRLHDVDDTKLSAIRSHGGIDVEGDGGGFAAVERATTDLAEAVDGSGIILIITGGQRQEGVARAIASLLRDGQLILLIQGNTGGSLLFWKALREAGCTADIDLAEMDNFPYSAPKLGPTKMRTKVTKQWLQIAAFPGNRIDAVFARLSPLFPTAVPAANVFFTGFTNANAMLHVANCVANATKIENGEPYKFYAEGVTPMVARLYEAINDERVQVAAAYGAVVPGLEDWIERVYGVREATLVETFRTLTFGKPGPYENTPTPNSFANNFVAEDVPTGLISMAALGKAAGVDTPAIQALVDISRVMSGDTYEEHARTLVRLGLAGMNVEQIRRTVAEGFKPI
jgi:opine dehydrogenase